MNVKVKSNSRETTATATMLGVHFGPDRKEPSATVVIGGTLCCPGDLTRAIESSAAELAIAACEAEARALRLMFPEGAL